MIACLPSSASAPPLHAMTGTKEMRCGSVTDTSPPTKDRNCSNSCVGGSKPLKQRHKKSGGRQLQADSRSAALRMGLVTNRQRALLGIRPCPRGCILLVIRGDG